MEAALVLFIDLSGPQVPESVVKAYMVLFKELLKWLQNKYYVNSIFLCLQQEKEADNIFWKIRRKNTKGGQSPSSLS